MAATALGGGLVSHRDFQRGAGEKHHSLGWAQVWDQAKKAEAHLKLDSHLGVTTQRFNSRARTKGDFVLLVSVVILFFD